MRKLEEDVGEALAEQPAHNEFAQHLGRSQTLFNQLSEKWQESYKDVEAAVANMVARFSP
jgi:nitrate/nitrite-specific signal transduction histidine kinase